MMYRCAKTLFTFMLGIAAASGSPLFTTGVIGGETDSLLIHLDPVIYPISGGPGATIGWGFSVQWTASQNYISFTGSSLGSVLSGETNSSLLAAYTDFIGANSGPDGIALGPGTWNQKFDPAAGTGVGAYQISLSAVPNAVDTGQITFNFDVYSGNPVGSGSYLGSFSYYGPSTAFSVVITPEPGTLGLLTCAGLAFALLRRWKGRPALIGKTTAIDA